MNNNDREWLARIDERTLNIWRVTEAQDKKIDLIIEHNERQNGSIMRNTLYRKFIVGVGGTGFIFVIGWLLKLTLGG